MALPKRADSAPDILLKGKEIATNLPRYCHFGVADSWQSSLKQPRQRESHESRGLEILGSGSCQLAQAFVGFGARVYWEPLGTPVA